MATYNFTKDTNQIVIENGNYGDLLNYSIKIESIQTREQPSLDNPAEILGVSGIIIKREEDNNIWNISLSDTVYDGLMSNNKITITADITGGFILSEQQWQAKNNSSIIMANGSAANTIKINKDKSEVGNAWINSYKCNLVTFSNTSNVFRCFITNNHNLSREQWKEVYGPKINIQYPLSSNIIKDFILPEIKLLSGTNTFSIQYIYGEKEIILTESAVKQLIENIKINDLSYTTGSWNGVTFTATPKNGKNVDDTSKKLTFTLPNGYGDNKNPYTSKAANCVLAGPISGDNATPSFRQLDASDIPSLTKSKISDFPTNVSAFTNDSGYLTSETDPTVPSWAKEDTKPSYALSEITGADDVKVIEALTGTSGLLKKTGTNTWALDTTEYEPKKITGVIKIGPPSSATTQISNITKYYSNLSDAQSGNNDKAISFGANFENKTVIISPATDADWILWRDSGIRCSNQANISGNGNSNGLTFKAEDNFSTTASTYANIIILN